ncbi:MAG TPA: BON domain-containing protein [Blastocatellia bacterium]|nr:BON domain-containing protein [Blastocatellia bacterium]
MRRRVALVLIVALLGFAGYYVYKNGWPSWVASFLSSEQQPVTQPPEENKPVEDLQIQAAVLEAFNRSPDVGGKSIDVKVQDRIVTLSGSVDTPTQRNGAEQAARAVDGVAGVTNNLNVTNPQAVAEPPVSAPAVDQNAELAKRVKFELYDSGAFETATMTVVASDGAVTLSGTVRSRAEQLLAERVAQGVPGVKKVTNELRVAQPANRR